MPTQHTKFDVGDLKIKLNLMSKEYEPFNSKLNQTSSRLSSNVVSPVGSKMAKTEMGTGRSPFSSVNNYGPSVSGPPSSGIGQYKQVKVVKEKGSEIPQNHSSHNQRSPGINYTRLINKRGSQPVIDNKEQGGLISNRFFDTFTKLQTLNAQMEFS